MRLWASLTCRTSRPKRGGDMAKLEKVDVVIVGAGASGSVYAAVLAKAGKKVVVLDQGPDWKASDLISSDFWGRRIKTAGAPFLLEGKNPVGYAYQSGWGVGGAVLHYFANLPRMLPNDFKIKSEHNRALDWPISYQDVAPYYDKVARDIGVSGNAKAEEIWRPAGEPYPMPPMKTFRHGEIWLKGFEAAGIRMVPAAVGMNSTEYKGRPACIYDGWCHVGCPTGALSNPLVTYLADARKAGAEVRARSTVTRVLTNPQGTRVTGVEYYDDKKERQVQEASVVVLAAWSAQNPRLLLNSATDRHPRGLANTSGLVGRYMMCHYSSGTWALFDEDVQNHLGTTGAQFMSYDRYGKTAHPGVFGSSFIVAGTALKTSDLGGFANARLDLFGPELHAFMKHAARQDPPQLRPGRGRAVERQLRGGPSHRQGHRRQGSVVGARQHADHPPHGRHHHGHRRGQLGGQQLRADPRAAEPLSRRAGHLPHGRSVESDLHDLCPLAARRRAARGEVEGGRPLRSARASAFSLLALANLLWAGNWVIGRALRDAFEPLALNFWRWLIAALVLAPFALPELARTRATLRRHAGLLALLALTGVAVFQTLVYLGLKTTTAMPCCSTLPPRCSCCCAPG